MVQMLGRKRPHSAACAAAPCPAVPPCPPEPCPPEPCPPVPCPAAPPLPSWLPPLGTLVPPSAAVPPGSVAPKPTEPWVNSSPAHCFLNTPLSGPPPAALGNSAVARLFQVLSATTASIRWSYAEASRAIPPP